MRRRWFLLLGVLLLAVNASLLTIGPDGGVGLTWSTVQTVAMLLAGLCFLIGGTEVADGVARWYRFVGAGDVLMGLALALGGVLAALGDGSFGGGPLDAGSTFYAVSAVVGGLALAFIGIDWARGGRHFDLSTFE